MSTSPEYAENYEAQTGAEPHTVPAVDVRVVEPVRVEEFAARTIVTDQVPAGIVAARIAPALRTRAKLTITPHGGAVYIGGPGVTPGTGYKLTDGQVVMIESTDDVWAITDPATPAGTVAVHTLAELREG